MRRIKKEAGFRILMPLVLALAVLAIVVSAVPTASAADTTNPVVTIVSPPQGAVYNTTSSAIDVSGACSDDVGVVSVDWSNSRGGTGLASLTDNHWVTSGILLYSGDNVITVYAHDAAGNVGTSSITVNYTPPNNEISYRDWTWVVVGIVAVALVLIVAYLLVFREKK